MPALIAIAILIALAISGWAIWFVTELIRYIASGEYEMDQRLRDICK